MKKEVQTVDSDRGIIQVTTYDERWYAKPRMDPSTGLPDGFDFVPSVTWIASYYPKGVGFWKWLAMKGWDEAEAIRAAAGGKGSKVHQAIANLIDGAEIPMGTVYINPATEKPEELTLDEYGCLMAFRDWWIFTRPVTLQRDFVVWNDQEHYAGTVDWIGTLEEPKGFWLLDFKTSSSVWPEHELQVSAYHAAIDEPLRAQAYEANMPGHIRLGILQVGYRQNKRGWKLTEVANQYGLFLAAKEIWAKETEGQAPFQAEYPLAVVLPVKGESPGPTPELIPKRRGRPKKVVGPVEVESNGNR